MTKHGAIAEGERRVRAMLGKSYNVCRQVRARDYILLQSDRELPAAYIVVGSVNSDGTVIEHRAE
jgi:hypothetical protein